VAQGNDVAAFDRRAGSYERGPLGEWHRLVVERTAEIALSALAAPGSVLDVGCGTALLLRLLAARLPRASVLQGVDPASAMIAMARGVGDLDPRVRLQEAAVEQLPFPDERFDLVVSSLSFDHWGDQGQGLREVARVLTPEGRLVLVDLFAGWLAVTTRIGRARARTPRRVGRLLAQASLRPSGWQRVFSLGPVPLVQAVVATRDGSAA
jgi:ubiquinone/menaquinone biosynthesis C-methylase UbiE